mmetsp:Transcript_7179/g.14576  ORF Transcript_7179/g.14576 Transcript_7179/m.14576 type:complete len:192 (+) Transcript_7179:258-833(+)|eukprot:CAMPEP_0118922902 /NCGR_PEP_ID=MMETSP1169-20130426/1650_1 /TAXON_ID=36882 /ORGANISM="Pyramimonas obovata, Strain CCMP722" /LENGTH=191 /DNA_ID=CAMNT_0006863831 /DNA_START=258 /DNA_END=833 /DNA_ORIENTATION=+
MVLTLEGRGQFRYKYLQKKPPSHRVQSSPNAFMTALYKMIEDASCDDTICWGDDQRSFHVWRPNHFEEILHKYFGCKGSFHTWRQRLTELGFERLPTDGRQPARGRTTLVSNWWTFTHAYFCRALVEKLQSKEEYDLKVWPFDAWRETIRDDYAWMATMNPGSALQLSVTEQEEQKKWTIPPYTETRYPVY